MREAMFYAAAADDHVLCTLCPHQCLIPPDRLGVCGVRFNLEGKLVTLVDRTVVAHAVEPIEKKPLFHFFPGSTAYSIATVGCNLHCRFCQNWGISQVRKHGPIEASKPGLLAEPRARLRAAQARILGDERTPEQIVAAARAAGSRSIAYTFTEPTVFFELAHETACRAHEAGLKNVFVSNGYIGDEALQQIAPVLDAINVDLKFACDADYRRICGGRLAPILRAIRRYHELGVWVEVTSLLVTGLNDSDAAIATMAQCVASVAPTIPWHVSRFFPAHRMTDRQPTPIDRLDRAVAIGREAGLQFVYQGNVPDPERESTRCPRCGRELIRRVGPIVLSNHITPAHRCPQCDLTIAGVGLGDGRARTEKQPLTWESP
ncbi:MAG: AmmeMemoRadiSam system radical SAM enzyme [Planctomycetota bacterium]